MSAALPALPALVSGVVRHKRSGPQGHGFSHRVYQWLVDLDDLPRLPWALRWAARFERRDHLGDPARSIKENVVNFVRLNGGEHLAIDRVLMLANARVGGYVFNPLSVFWCYAADGREVAVVAEVHNTYGERHAYLLSPDENGRSEVNKEFYVSPFNDISGKYRLLTTVTAQRVVVRIGLTGQSAPTFSASFDGIPEPATTRAFARTVLRHPLMTLQVSGLIRAHGIWLWARGHRIQPRPAHRVPAGVSHHD